ncbi:MAG TPA: hypothetical protein VIX12_05485 [Candidatus Binataceae bacterium]
MITRACLGDLWTPRAAPMQAVVGGMKFFGDQARIVLTVQAVFFLTFALGIVARRRWGLLLALFYMAEVVLSHLVFILVYFTYPGESFHVRMAAVEGPSMVLITLYLWIRSKDLIFKRVEQA